MSNQISISEEQTMLLETAVNFCRERSPISVVRQSIADAQAYDAALWREMVDLGWLSIAVPEEHGGLGLGLAGVVPVAESMGRNLLGSPFLATTLAIHALTTSASAEQQARYLPELAAGKIGTVALTEEDGNWQLEDIQLQAERENGGLKLRGCKNQVLDELAADVLLVSAMVDGVASLVVVEAGQLPRENIRAEVVIDETRRSYVVDFTGVVVGVDHIISNANFTALEQAGLLLLSAEMSGGLAGVLHTIVEYLTTRKQFDQYIGSYQALKHPTVDILLAEEAQKSHVYHAATMLDEGSAVDIEISLRMAKAHGSEQFAFAGDRAVQFHCGFGFTYECDAQLYLRRALWCQHQFGDERHHRQLLTPMLLDDAG